MKYYTKEWYQLMQRMDYTCGIQKIPDKEYTKAEIRAFYERDLQKEIARDRKIYNTPPSAEWSGNYEEEMIRFRARPPFDPAETIDCFAECYRGKKRCAGNSYPAWFRETADMRLLALDRIPESAYSRLKKEERANKRRWNQINAEARAVLSAQEIPDAIRTLFRFHDANVLKIAKTGENVEMVLRDGGFMDGDTPYCRVIFQKVSGFVREKGLVIRTRPEESGEYGSNVIYLYDELYRTDSGYEVHMLLTGTKELRYLTVLCEDIRLEKSIPFPDGKG